MLKLTWNECKVVEWVGFTGTADPTTVAQREAFHDWLQGQEPGEFHHGDCVNADADAGTIAFILGWTVVLHPPSNESKRAFSSFHYAMPAKPYLDRNHDIVDATKILCAMPKGREELRSGTWATVRYARKLKRPVVFFWPNGTLSTEGFFLEKLPWQFS